MLKPRSVYAALEITDAVHGQTDQFSQLFLCNAALFTPAAQIGTKSVLQASHRDFPVWHAARMLEEMDKRKNKVKLGGRVHKNTELQITSIRQDKGA